MDIKEYLDCPEIEETPKLKRMAYGNIVGWFPSIKNKEMLRYESTIERDLMFILEYEKDVLRYTTHPFKINSLAYLGEAHSYIPDFLIIYRSRKEIVECKPEDKLNDQGAIQQITIGNDWGKLNNHDFRVVTDKELRTGHYLKGLKKIFRYSRKSVSYEVISKTKEVLNEHPNGVRLNELCYWLSGKVGNFHFLPDILSLLFRQVLFTNLMLPLNHESLIWLAN